MKKALELSVGRTQVWRIGVAVFTFASFAFGPVPTGSTQEMNCAEPIKSFIEQIDATLDNRPQSVTVLEAVLARHFPMSHCDAGQLIVAVKKSKYFLSAYENPNIKDLSAQTIAFHLRSQEFNVYFSLLKAEGVTRLHAAGVRKD